MQTLISPFHSASNRVEVEKTVLIAFVFFSGGYKRKYLGARIHFEVFSCPSISCLSMKDNNHRKKF